MSEPIKVPTAEDEAEADLQIARAKAIAAAKKLDPGVSPFKPKQEAGLNWEERTALKNFGPSDIKSQIEWLGREQGKGGKGDAFILPGSKLIKEEGIVSNPVGRYDAVEYSPGKIAVRPWGAAGKDKPWKVVDPDTGLFSKDLPMDALDLVYDVARSIPGGKSILGGAAAMGVSGGLKKAISTHAYGFKEDPLSAGLETGLEVIGGGIAPPASKLVGWAGGKAAQVVGLPKMMLDKLGRRAERDALEKAVQARAQARMAKNELSIGATEEAAQRAAAVEALAKKAGVAKAPMETPPVKAPPVAPTVPVAEAAAGMSEEAITEAFSKSQNSHIRFLSRLTHPAWGVKAQYIDYLPEWKNMGTKWFGPEFISPLGSRSMVSRARNLSALETEIDQNRAKEVAVGWAKDVSQWLLSDERKGAISLAEKEALDRMQKGILKEGDDIIANKLISRIAQVASKAPEMAAAESALKLANQKAQVAADKLRLPAEDKLGQVGDWYNKQRSNLRGSLFYNLPVAAEQPTKFGAWAMGKVGDPILTKIMGLTPAKLAIDVKGAPASIQSTIWKILRPAYESGDTTVFYTKLAELIKIPAIRQWMDTKYSSPKKGD